VVNFFATWCVPCQHEHPELVDFARRHSGAGDASVVSVVFQDETAAVRSFFAEKGGDWPVVLDHDGAVALDYGVTGIPESFLVSPNGTVVDKLIGGVDSGGLDALLQAEQAKVGGTSR
jgi:cytochrome c biogenesis protein CcmG/thiol:disulfide interchange protein DsbE